MIASIRNRHMLEQMGIAAKRRRISWLLSSGEKIVLEKIADELEAQMESILGANIARC